VNQSCGGALRSRLAGYSTEINRFVFVPYNMCLYESGNQDKNLLYRLVFPYCTFRNNLLPYTGHRFLSINPMTFDSLIFHINVHYLQDHRNLLSPAGYLNNSFSSQGGKYHDWQLVFCVKTQKQLIYIVMNLIILLINNSHYAQEVSAQKLFYPEPARPCKVSGRG